MAALKTLESKVNYRVARKRDAVFTPGDFEDLGGRDQVGRALRKLVAAGKLVRLGYGVYGRAKVSSLTGRVMLDAPNGFVGASRQALTKLGVVWEPSEAETAYNLGRSTQIPVNPAVKVVGGKKRFKRRLSYNGSELRVER